MSHQTSDFRYRLWMWLPPLLAVLAIVWGIGREYWAESEYKSAVNELADQGLPVTTTQIRDRYTNAEVDERSAEWTELFDAVVALREMSRDSVEGMDDLVPPGQPWPAEPFAALMSEKAAPLMAKFRELLASNTPIGSSSNYAAIPELLEDEFQFAYHSGESELALSVLEQWRKFVETLNASNRFQVWAQSSLMDAWFRTVRTSVTHEFWNEEQLQRLVSLSNGFHAIDIAERNDSRLASFVAWDPLQDSGVWVRYSEPNLRSTQPFGASAVHALAALQWIQRRDDVEGIRYRRRDRKEWQAKEQALTDETRSLVSVPSATLNRNVRNSWGVATEYGQRQEDSFRDRLEWTLTAINLRKYQVENGQFPRSLDALRTVGANDDDWTLATGERLGYRVGDGSKDGDQAVAVLWTDDGTNQGEEEPGVGRIPYSERKWGAGRAKQFEIWFD
ncbi:hypothetical protein LOC71_00330 [Rhodopirellula sp. JC740]|uniref:Uncharacterized protein n=1 Tax=Rhodopirellula halodulae TaxID=2894198 RepID=A0ABS8NAV7_9BACT|nr:hypothetical protein [Rhodopirellula sp. JC740]MCC9640703.1 hypothetical protein [Rhodopirellula sp. JC740]